MPGIANGPGQDLTRRAPLVCFEPPDCLLGCCATAPASDVVNPQQVHAA
jgi:hypothetical protein